MKLLLIDNYDSFTHNLYQLFGELGVEQLVVRNDAVEAQDAGGLGADAIVISPGPGRPVDAGISRAVISTWGRRMPILGVCLGMQCIAEVFGGSVRRAGQVVHGKTSLITHEGTDLFDGVPSPCRVARYHSLVVDDLPACLEVTARTTDGVPMAIRHIEAPIWGVQFHPESFLGEHGKIMMRNFLHGAQKQYERSFPARSA